MFLGNILALEGVVGFAKSAVTVLIAILAIYLSVRLLGKLAKFVIMIVVLVVAIYFLSSTGILGQIKSALDLGALLL